MRWRKRLRSRAGFHAGVHQSRECRVHRWIRAAHFRNIPYRVQHRSDKPAAMAAVDDHSSVVPASKADFLERRAAKLFREVHEDLVADGRLSHHMLSENGTHAALKTGDDRHGQTRRRMFDVYCDRESKYSLCPSQGVTLTAFCSPEGSVVYSSPDSRTAINRPNVTACASLTRSDSSSILGKLADRRPKLMRSALSKHKERWLNFK